MKIILVGSGKVGTALARQLSEEGHNVTVVDTNKARVEHLIETYDVLGIVGNGSSITTLSEAGIEDADVFIAVTGSDELNLLCCMFAKKAGHCHGIARVRNPSYSHELDFIKKQIGISAIINPEMATAKEISHLLRFPGASKIDTFADGRVRLIKFALTATPKGWNDTSLDLLWRYNLHYFDFLSAPLQPDTASRPSPQGLIARWIAENPRGSAPGWDPYPTSLRIVNWVKWLGRNEPTEPLRASLAEQVAWLERHLEWHLGANHLLANLKALILGSRCLGRDDTRWRRLYREQLDEQVLPDGGHFERSVMYHAIILEDVLDVMRVCGATADGLKPIAARMLHYLVNLTGPDGKIALFNDAADGIAKPTAWLRDAARAGGVASVDAGAFADFPQTGYARLAAGDFVLFVDAAPIGPDYQPGHAHADTLTYELYYKGRKVVTDAGTSEYRGSRRAFERSTAAHNVVEVGGRDSSEVWSSHRVGARARTHVFVLCIVYSRSPPPKRLATHRPFSNLPNATANAKSSSVHPLPSPRAPPNARPLSANAGVGPGMTSRSSPARQTCRAASSTTATPIGVRARSSTASRSSASRSISPRTGGRSGGC